MFQLKKQQNIGLIVIYSFTLVWLIFITINHPKYSCFVVLVISALAKADLIVSNKATKTPPMLSNDWKVITNESTACLIEFSSEVESPVELK